MNQLFYVACLYLHRERHFEFEDHHSLDKFVLNSPPPRTGIAAWLRRVVISCLFRLGWLVKHKNKRDTW